MIDVFMPYKKVNQLNSITPVVWDHVKRNTLPICADRTAHAESDRQSEVTRANLLLIIMCTGLLKRIWSKVAVKHWIVIA